ncbi:MAG: Cache domain protein [Methanosaeta sp. PtaB.Bin039]|nr:MAG: Cache domain protein [Methanosaeta sp. PtaB.Bin039]
MKRAMFLIYLFLAVCLLSLASQGNDRASAQSYAAPTANESDRQVLVSFLNEARDYLLETGKDEAFQAFNDPDGEFVRGDMYVFAYDFNGTLLSHPFLTRFIGRNNLDLRDINGIHIINNMLSVARMGDGFAYAVYPDPIDNYQMKLKLYYLLKADDDMWIGSGINLPGQAPLFSFDDQRKLKRFVEEARSYALREGKDAALQVFNDPEGAFVRDGLYIFAYDFMGNSLSLPFQPDLLGDNRLDVLDANGVAVTRDNLELARGGSGQTYYLYPNPKEEMRDELKLSYTTAVDDTWWLAAGVYSTQSSSNNASDMKPSDRDELKTLVETAFSHVMFTSKKKALRDFMDLNSSWVRGDVYIFAQDFNGTSLCLPYQPAEVGTNRLDIQNDQGVFINREMRSIALNGSGYYEYIWRNPITNQSEAKLSYVMKVDDTWWLGSGFYLEEAEMA